MQCRRRSVSCTVFKSYNSTVSELLPPKCNKWVKAYLFNFCVLTKGLHGSSLTGYHKTMIDACSDAYGGRDGSPASACRPAMPRAAKGRRL